MSLTQPLEDAIQRAPELQQIAAQMNNKNLSVDEVVVKTFKESMPLPEEKFDFNYKFKKLIPALMERLNPNYINTNGKLSGVLYSAAISFNKTTKFTVEKAKTLGTQIYTASIAAKAGIDKTHEVLVLLGQKAQVLKSKEKIEKSLQDAGVSFEGLMINKKHIEPDYDKINFTLKAHAIEMGFSEDMEFDFENCDLSVLKNPAVNEKLKKEIVEKVVWPKIKHELQHSMSLISVAANLKNIDPYIRQLNTAAQENKITSAAMVVMLTSNPNMLRSLKSTSKVLANSEKIIEATQKYTDFINSATYISSFYASLAKATCMKYLGSSEQKSIMEEKFLVMGHEDLNLNEIEARLSKIGFIEQFTVKSTADKVREKVVEHATPSM